jgi:hypothetical protein
MPIGTPTTLGTNANGAGTSGTLTTSAIVPSGALAGLCIGWGVAAAATITSISGGGLTWTVDHSQPFNGAINWGFAVASAQAPAGLAASTVITVNMTGGGVLGLLIGGWYCTGLDTGAPVDVHTGQNQTADPWSTGNVSTTVADTLVIGGSLRNGQGTNTPSGGANELQDFQYATEQWSQCTEYKILSAAGSVSLDGTWNAPAGTPDVAAALVAYKAAPAGADTGLAWIKA